MAYQDVLRELFNNGTVASVLKKGSPNKVEIQALQNILHEMGFDTILKWQTYGADGGYGGGTTEAIKLFAARNRLPGDGTEVTLDIAKRLLLAYDIVDDIRHLADGISSNTIKDFYYYGTNDIVSVVALQTLLNTLGFGNLLNYKEKGADGCYDDTVVEAVKAFAARENIVCDGKIMTKEVAEHILNIFKPYFGDDLVKTTEPMVITKGVLNVSEAVRKGKTRVIVSDGALEAQFTRFQRGLYTSGERTALNFISNNKSLLSGIGLTNSAVNIMVAVSENEGNLDAINTWDNSFMTFGMFQWTIGPAGDPGELPALLKKIKDKNPNVFNKFYGQFGLDVVGAGEISGYFSLNGVKVDSASKKEKFRSPEWSFYFWRSGQDPAVQALQIQHALSRIGLFYRSNAYKINNYFVADLITSEYGIGLILDNHVNRPGYIKPCLTEAFGKMANTNPSSWGTNEERQLISNYLRIRESYGRSPMTDAAKRASVTKKYLEKGAISDQRGSFQYNPQ